jgi:two-component system sensor histidine kinase NreB
MADERKRERERIAKMITHSVLQAQENERKRLSRELHDSIGQALYSALIQTDVAADRLENGGNPAGAADILRGLHRHVRQTIEEVRHLSSELRPSILDDMGLVAALRNYVQEINEKFGFQVNFSYDGDKSRLPAAMETALYRIAQEALTNAAKYARSDRVDVVLIQQPHTVTLTVQDYGAGFRITEETERGVGLYSMEERASILGGSLKVESVIGAGTTVTAVLPLPKEEADDEHQSSAGG